MKICSSPYSVRSTRTRLSAASRVGSGTRACPRNGRWPLSPSIASLASTPGASASSAHWTSSRAPRRAPEKWSLATFPCDRQAGLEARVIRQLGTLDFVGRAENLVLVGPPGVGKTGIATGLLLRALESGYRGRFLRAQDLFDELYASLADRSTRKLLDSLARVDVLLVDEMGYLNLRPEQSNAFFKLMEERYVAKHTTLITTNLAYDAWYEFLGNKKMVEALLDRLRQRCHTITIEGPSLRTPAASA